MKLKIILSVLLLFSLLKVDDNPLGGRKYLLLEKKKSFCIRMIFLLKF